MSFARMVWVTPLALVLGCATQPTKARGEVDALLAERAGLEQMIEPEPGDDHATRVLARVDELLAQPLDEQIAIRVALLNNRGFMAALEQLGVAQADLVEAGLLDNPVIGGDLVVSTLGNGLGGGMSLAQSLLSVFLIPAKRRVAKAELQHAIVTAGQTALTLVRDTKIAYANFEAAAAERELRRRMVQAAEVGDELARAQAEAGNLPARNRELVGAELDEARLELLDAELQLATAREQLNRLLGVWGDRLDWTAGPARELPETEPELAGLVERGVQERLDLSAARFQVTSIDYALQLRRRGLVPDVQIGVGARNEVGNDVGHEWVVGPSLSIELPIFNPGHADLARIRALLRQAQHLLADKAITARSEIRLDRETLVAARRRVEYLRSTVLPRQQAIYDRSLELYNAMSLGPYELLEVRRDQLEVEVAHAMAIRDYWAARAQLEYGIGGRLPDRGSTGVDSDHPGEEHSSRSAAAASGS